MGDDEEMCSSVCGALFVGCKERGGSNLCAIVTRRGYVVVTISCEPIDCLPICARGHWLVSIGWGDILRMFDGSSYSLFNHLLFLTMDFLEAPFDM